MPKFRVGDSIQFVYSRTNPHLVYRVAEINDATAKVTYAYPHAPADLFEYTMPLALFYELSPYHAVLNQEEVNTLVNFYRGALLDILGLVEKVQLVALLFGEDVASEIMSMSDIEALNDIVDEYGAILYDLYNYGLITGNPVEDDALTFYLIEV